MSKYHPLAIEREHAPDEDSDHDPFVERERNGKSTLEQQKPNNHRQMHTWRQVDGAKMKYTQERISPKVSPFA